MAIYETFSKRQKKQRGEVPDIYVYEEISKPLRVQIVHVITDTIGRNKHQSRIHGFQTTENKVYSFIHKTLCKEYGVHTLTVGAKSNGEAVLDYFLNCDEYERCLDIIEICFRLIENFVGKNYGDHKQNTTSTQDPIDAVNELNARFKESGVGYQFESGELIRIDSQFIHAETVKPVLYLLSSDKAYRGANDEFLSAHEHYRHKRYKECLNDCLKSFESLMKAIHEKHSWSYNQNDTAQKLINSCLSNNLVPAYLQNQFSLVGKLLESGIPTIRNKEGGHGQGADITTVPDYFASYALHLTATNLLFLANCEKEL